MDSRYIHGLMVLITSMVSTQTHGIVLVLLITHVQGGRVFALMQDFLNLLMMLYAMPLSVLGFLFALKRGYTIKQPRLERSSRTHKGEISMNKSPPPHPGHNTSAWLKSRSPSWQKVFLSL